MDEFARYVPDVVREIWSPHIRVVLERELWIAVFRFHKSHGVVSDPDDAIEDALIRALFDVDLDSINRRERVTRHDLKARLEEYLAVAAVPEVLHLGMTSADVVDNISLVQMSMTLRYLGAMTGDEQAYNWSDWLPFRGIKGAVGTQQDQLDLLGRAECCDELDRWVAGHFQFEKVLNSVGQVYPRSIDLQYAIVTHRFASRHKLTRLLSDGYMAMAVGYSGDQWNEGDVSTSVVRRVCLPGLSFAAAAAVHGALP